jgi:hypothetical protein
MLKNQHSINTIPLFQLKRGKPDVENTLKQIDALYPEELREDAKNAVLSCKDEMKGHKDPCEGAFKSLMCLFKIDPDFFFP